MKTVIFAVFVLTLSLVPCTSSAQSREVIDMTGRVVVIPESINRIVATYRVATQMLLILEASDKIVSVSFRPNPMTLRMFPELETAGIANRHASIEEILRMKPDVVFAYPGDQVQSLDAAGIAVVTLVVENPEALVKGLGLMAQVLGKTERAGKLAAYYQDKLKYITERTSRIQDRKRVYFMGGKLLTTIGGDFYQDHIINMAGGISVSHDLHGGWVSISREHLLAWNPDVILTVAYYSSSLRDELLSDSGLSSLSAVKNGKVYAFPVYLDSWDLPSPESILGIMWLAGILYPGEISFDIAREAREFYTIFYGSYPEPISLEGRHDP
ncbi:MAG: ABC transporter substrate-binding protein [Desulfomonilia bacterium]|nr:ABC transporter substrate-binding protein [Desulfomonilia bacterium]